MKEKKEQFPLKSKIEALLFASGQAVSLNKLASFLKIKKVKLKQELISLKNSYLENKGGLLIIEKGDKIQLVSNPALGKTITAFFNKEINEPLSRPALEILSVIAYRGPITRAGIEEIRGVNCSFTLRSLAIRGLIERANNPADARSYIYTVSFDLVKSLGLDNIEALPNFKELKVKDNS